jgi:tetratricopeptide (TPR) repeat protein
MLLFPEMITKENRSRLLELAGKTDAYWQPRLTAAIHFRSGDYKKAAKLFDANEGGPQFFFQAAMTQYKLGNQDRAKQLLNEGNAWIGEQRAKDPGAGVPRPNSWLDWAFVITLQYEASELILGPSVGSDKRPERPVGDAQFQAALARHFAARGNARAADAARARARPLFAEKLAKEPENSALAAGLLSAYKASGRTREAIPHLAKASAAHLKDTLLSLNVAALQVWFGQEKELAATRKRLLAFAKDTSNADIANTASKICSISPSTDKAELEAALDLGHLAVKLYRNEWTLLSSGMAEYRSGNYAATDQALLDAINANPNNPHIAGTAAFYRAMSLFRQGKEGEARKLAILAAAKMKPLPKDDNNPLAGGADHNDLILWLAYKEAKAMILFEAAPAANWMMRALTHHRLGETSRAKKACRNAADMFKLAGPDAALRPLLRQTVLSLGTESPEVKELIAAAAGDLPATLNEAIEQNPDQAKGCRERGNWYGERGRWKDAIADHAEVFRLDPNTLDAMRLGILLAYSGEKDRYREHSQAMLSRWASTEKNNEADQTLKTIILLPDYKADAKELARLAEAAVAGDPTQDWYEWWQVAKALHDLRIGRYADALTACRASRQRAPQSKGEPQVLTALDLVIEAMALQGAGSADEARRTLDQVKPLIESHVPGIDGGDWWADWLSAHILYREAVSQIAAKKAESKK